MTRMLLAALFVCAPVLLLAAAPAAAQDADRPAVRLIAEAEDFTVRQGEWDVVPYRENYYASTFALTFLSRMGALGAPPQTEGEAIAEQRITIPYADRYEVLARYEQPYNFSVEFEVEVEQNGKVVYRHPFGRLDQVKIWGCSGSPEARRAPMQRFFWGATDNIVWQAGDAAPLQAGEATIRLIAQPQRDGDQLRELAAKRQIDLICLTNDAEGREAQRNFRNTRTYLEMDGWLTQAGDLYINLTNRGDAPISPVLAPFNQGQHSPYYVHLRDWPSVRVLGGGFAQSPRRYVVAGPRSDAVDATRIARRLDDARFAEKNPPAEAQLQPGKSSGFVPMGGMLDALHNSKWILNTPAPTDVRFAVPDGSGGLKVVRELSVDAGRTVFEMPGVVNPNAALAAWRQETGFGFPIRTDMEAVEWLTERVRQFPDIGRVPERFFIYNIGGFSATSRSEQGRTLMRELGDNTMLSDEKRGLVAHWRNPAPEALEAAAQQYATRRGMELDAAMDRLYIVSYGDEMHLPAIRPTDEAFVAWLKERGVERPNAKYTTDRNDPLFYYSQIAAKENGAKRYAAGTAWLGERGVLTGTNYSPHSNYLVTELDYIRPFKLRAITMPWSEDYVWQIPEFSVQVTGYLTSAFRAGAKYHDDPIHMYIMPHSPGNTPESFRRSFYTAIAHGAKMINYFCGSPLATGATENYVDTADLGMWRQIHDCTHEAGAFEDYVMDGGVRPARVGLLLSSVDEIKTGANNATFAMHNNERKAIFYALRHNNIPVDFLSEDDVIEGLAKDYDVIYVTQQWLHSNAVEALRKWVEQGGTVVAHVGGGFLNEFNQPNPKTGELYGVRTQKIVEDPHLVEKYLLVPNKPFLSKQDLPVYEPFDRVSYDAGGQSLEDVGVIVWKQQITPSDGKVIGTFADGSPAVIEKAHGRGRAVLVGFLPGQAYLKSGLPVRPVDRGSTNDAYTHYIPTEMDAALGRAIFAPYLPADYQPPVTTETPLVEAALIDTHRPQRRIGVPLINYSDGPVDALTVRVASDAPPKAVRSVKQGKLTATHEDGQVVVTLPLEIADMLLIDF